jgi:hypothetical protein
MLDAGHEIGAVTSSTTTETDAGSSSIIETR